MDNLSVPQLCPDPYAGSHQRVTEDERRLFFFNNPYNYLKLHRLFHHSFVSCLNSSLLNIDFNSLPLMLCVCVCVFRCVGVCTLFLMSCEVQMSHC